MDKPTILPQNVKPLLETPYLNVYDLEYAPGKHYFDATRRKKENLVASKNLGEFKTMHPDAVSCVVILSIKGQEPLLLLTYEFRYPAGQFLLSIPAGLIDAADLESPEPLLITAKRELEEETGIVLCETDSARVISPFLFSTPGMTDESNALVELVIRRDSMPSFSQDGAVGSECFDGFSLLTKQDAMRILQNGVDDNGLFYSVYTWTALSHFVSDRWI